MSDGVHWIGVTAQYRRRLQVLSFAGPGAVAVFAMIPALMIAFGAPAPAFPGIPVAIAIVVLAGAAQIVAVILLRRLDRRRLGTDGHDFLFDSGNGKIEQYPFAALLTGDQRQLLAGKRLIPLYAPLGALFDVDELHRYIFARMTPSSRIGPFALFREALFQGNRQILLPMSICLAVVILLLLQQIWY
ncbi:MAG: hypothetical protein HY848_13375 [Betaproteobacteria bacterium]|nr:hypothetical protein [Betaproteobacteria bacterium]